MNYSNALSIDPSGKGIPYGGTGELREDGDANYGFKNLKGSFERLSDIPELTRDEALRNLVKSLNLPDSAFATVGCASALMDEEQGHRVSGYVEFAFDSVEGASDAANYFPVFFHFNRALHGMKFDDKVHFHWELMGASFLMSKVERFTVSVTINTGWYPSVEEAGFAWANGCDFLAAYLRQVPPKGTPFFSDSMNLPSAH